MGSADSRLNCSIGSVTFSQCGELVLSGMLGRISRFLRGVDRRVKVTLLSSGIYNFGAQLSTQYNTLFAQALGANGTTIGLLASLSAAVGSVAAIPLGSAIEKQSMRKILLLGLVLDAIGLAIFSLAWNIWTLIPAFILYQLIKNMPLADVLFITFTEPQKRSTVMSLSRVFLGGINVFAPLIGAMTVDYFGGINAQGIRPIYYIQLAVLAAVFSIIAIGLGQTPLGNKENKDKPKSKKTGFIQEYRQLFRGQKYLKRWQIMRVIRSFGESLLLLFVTLWMVNVKGASPTILGIVGSISVLAAMCMQIPVARLSDKIGRKKTFFLITPFYCLGVLLLIAAPSPEYLILVGVLGGVGAVGGISGGIGGVAFVPFVTMSLEMVPAEKRGKWFGFGSMVNSLPWIPASLIGGILWDQGFQIPLLLIPILIEFLVVIPLVHTIPETLGSKQ